MNSSLPTKTYGFDINVFISECFRIKIWEQFKGKRLAAHHGEWRKF